MASGLCVCAVTQNTWICLFLCLSASLFFSGLLALSPLQAPDRPQSLGCARGWTATETTARPSDPGQTKDLRSLHKPPQVSLQRDVLKNQAQEYSGFLALLEFRTIWNPFKTYWKLLLELPSLLFACFKWSLIRTFSPRKPPFSYLENVFIKIHSIFFHLLHPTNFYWAFSWCQLM